MFIRAPNEDIAVLSSRFFRQDMNGFVHRRRIRGMWAIQGLQMLQTVLLRLHKLRVLLDLRVGVRVEILYHFDRMFK
jgi:hypothetical protein